MVKRPLECRSQARYIRAVMITPGPNLRFLTGDVRWSEGVSRVNGKFRSDVVSRAVSSKFQTRSSDEERPAVN
jgi:hypothetical protein